MRAGTRLRRSIRSGMTLVGRLTAPKAPGVVIVAYHRVGGGSQQELDLPTDEFERQVRYLAEHYRTVTLDDLTEPRFAERLTEPVVAVTFDDGYEDVYTHAFPVLQEHGVPATVYLATSFVDSGEPFPWTPDGARPMSWKQASEMVDSGLVTMGAHTHTHPNLGRLADKDVEDELVTSKQRLAERLGLSRVHFSFPMPSRVPGDFCPPLARRIAAREFATVAVEGYRINIPPLDVHNLMRVPVHRSDTHQIFQAGLAGYLAPYARLQGFAHRLRGVREAVGGRRNSRFEWS